MPVFEFPIRGTRSGPTTRTSKRKRWTAVGSLAALTGAVLVGGLSLASTAQAALAPVGLGTAGTYSVLGGQTVTNTGPSTLSGDLGLSPGTAITGFPPGIVGGAMHTADAPAAQAQSDLTIAYDDAAGRAPTASVAGDLVGQTLTAGVYQSTGPLALSGTLSLDGQGDPSSVFIFQVSSTLITASDSQVNVINGAQACHIFWQVGSSATLGTTSVFKGTIMALTSISATTGTVVEGRALARNGQVSLDNNVFTIPVCATPTTTTTEPTSTTTAPTTTTSTTTAPTTTTTAPGSIPRFVRGTYGLVSEEGSVSVSLSSKPKVGNLLVALAESSETVPNTVITATVKDGSTAFTLVRRYLAPDGAEMSIWVLPVTSGVGAKVTATPTSSPADMGLGVVEYSGLSGAVRALTSNSGPSCPAGGTCGYTRGSTVSSGSGAQAQAGDLVVGFEEDSGWLVDLWPDTAGGYTERLHVANNSLAEFVIEDQVAPAAGLFNARSTIRYTSGTGGWVSQFHLPGVPWAMETVVFAHS